MVSPSFFPATVYGGPIFSIYYTCLELAKGGVTVFVVTTNANGNEKLDVQANCVIKLEDNFFVKYYDDTLVGRFSWRFIVSIWKEIKECDLVRIEDIFSTYVPPALLYAKIFRKPMVISPRGVLSPWALKCKRTVLKKMWLQCFITPFAKTSCWHVTSEQEKIDVLALYPNADVVAIPNGIDISQFSNAPPMRQKDYFNKFLARSFGNRKKKVVVSMGRLHKTKGFSVLIEAFSRLLADVDEAVLMIAGSDNGEKSNLERLINQCSLQEKVFLIGEVGGQDKVDFLAGADLFVLPSFSESFGNVYLEAMAAGVPIVASTGTPWAAVEQLHCGKWVDPSVEATRAAMQELLMGPHAEMGIAAKAYASTFDWREVAMQFKILFVQLLGSSSKKHPSQFP